MLLLCPKAEAPFCRSPFQRRDNKFMDTPRCSKHWFSKPWSKGFLGFTRITEASSDGIHRDTEDTGTVSGKAVVW